MTERRVLVVQGHPDSDPERLCRALGAAYADGAQSAGHEVRYADIATLEYSVLRTKAEFDHDDPSLRDKCTAQ